MLFAVLYTYRPRITEADVQRLMQLFTNWTPPQGLDLKAHYSRADARGGIILSESDSATPQLEAAAYFAPYIESEIVPLMDITESMPLLQRVIDQRASVR